MGEDIVAWDISGTLVKNGYDTYRFDYTIYPAKYTATVYMQHITLDAAVTGMVRDADTNASIPQVRVILLNTKLTDDEVSRFNSSVQFSAFREDYFGVNEAHAYPVSIEGSDPEISWTNSSIVDIADEEGDFSMSAPPYSTRYFLVGKAGYYCKIVSGYVYQTTNKRIDIVITSQ